MLGDYVVYDNVSLCCGGSYHICSRFYLIGDNGVFGSVELIYSAYFYYIGAGAHNIGAHRIQEVGEINYVGLLCGVFKNGKPFGFGCRQNRVDCGAYRYAVKIDLSSHKLVRFYVNYTMFDIVVRAQRFKAFKMLIYGAVSQITASRH